MQHVACLREIVHLDRSRHDFDVRLFLQHRRQLRLTAEQLGLNFEDLTGRYNDFKFAVMGKLHGQRLFTALKLCKRHFERVNIFPK